MSVFHPEASGNGPQLRKTQTFIQMSCMSITLHNGIELKNSEALQILSNYNNNPYDLTASKMTFEEVYNEWSCKKYPTISESNVHSYKASYNACTVLWHKTFKDIKLNDLQMYCG